MYQDRYQANSLTMTESHTSSYHPIFISRTLRIQTPILSTITKGFNKLGLINRWFLLLTCGWLPLSVFEHGAVCYKGKGEVEGVLPGNLLSARPRNCCLVDCEYIFVRLDNLSIFSIMYHYMIENTSLKQKYSPESQKQKIQSWQYSPDFFSHVECHVHVCKEL